MRERRIRLTRSRTISHDSGDMPLRRSNAVQTHLDPADGVALVSVRGAALLTGHTWGTVYRWVRLGRVKTRRVAGNGRLRIEVASLYVADAEAAASASSPAPVEVTA